MAQGSLEVCLIRTTADNGRCPLKYMEGYWADKKFTDVRRAACGAHEEQQAQKEVQLLLGGSVDQGGTSATDDESAKGSQEGEEEGEGADADPSRASDQKAREDEDRLEEGD